MNMIGISSSAINAAGYDEQTMHMRITFQQGHTYDFCGVILPPYPRTRLMRNVALAHRVGFRAVDVA